MGPVVREAHWGTLRGSGVLRDRVRVTVMPRIIKFQGTYKKGWVRIAGYGKE